MALKTMKYMQPRPSSIVAALYTARDLGVDVSILHGPSGCSFKHARLLEEDGMRVLTTSLADHEFIFGGQQPLEATPLRISKRQKLRITPSSGLSATFSPFEGEKGL